MNFRPRTADPGDTPIRVNRSHCYPDAIFLDACAHLSPDEARKVARSLEAYAGAADLRAKKAAKRKARA